MSDFRGFIEADLIRAAHRLAHREVSVVAQSWEGSVKVRMWNDSEGRVRVEIKVGAGSTVAPDERVWRGPLAELLEAGAMLILVKQGLTTEPGLFDGPPTEGR